MTGQASKKQFFISNAHSYYFAVDKDVPVTKEVLIALGCVFHESLELMYKHVMEVLHLDISEVHGSEILIVNQDGILKVSQHAHFYEIKLGSGESINHYIAEYIN